MSQALETTAVAPRIGVITGAGSGIGRAVAIALERAGFFTVLAGRRESELKATAELGNPARMLPLPADVTDENAVRKLFDTVRDKFGRLDLLFNNAGVSGAPALPDDVSLQDWRKVIDVNLNGAFLCAREAFLLMRHQQPCGGRIINNGSLSAHVPRPQAIAYNASKHAITGLTKSLSLDGRAFDIVCGQIDIGNAASEMTEKMTAGVLQADGSKKPEPRLDVRHVADAVVYMANLPLDANVQFLTVMASKMPFIGRG